MSAPRYPVYVPTKGRWHLPLTIRFLLRDRVPFRAVIEAEEYDHYASVAGEERLLVLPESGRGLLYSRNWIKAHSITEGHARHWQIDDNIQRVYRQFHGHRVPCDSGPALAAVEDLVDRYTNVGLAGLQYDMFGVRGRPPFLRNVHVYSCTLVSNAMPYQWRLVLNDDTDLCLQVLAGGLCTILVLAFMVKKTQTMKVSGGNTDAHYQGDGRLQMARSLERVWPRVVEVKRRYGRPQHVIRWTKFDTPLQLRPDVDLAALPDVDEYGWQLHQVRPIKAPAVQQLLEEHGAPV